MYNHNHDCSKCKHHDEDKCPNFNARVDGCKEILDHNSRWWCEDYMMNPNAAGDQSGRGVKGRVDGNVEGEGS